ncbi:dopamine receptor 2-like [Tubulanus polymorphus]|uniref:dopamine receptor 2-like n=1 Tax=Tubulanus polymorphus TaxID=672921 RepID=UPI003DA4F27A
MFHQTTTQHVLYNIIEWNSSFQAVRQETTPVASSSMSTVTSPVSPYNVDNIASSTPPTIHVAVLSDLVSPISPIGHSYQANSVTKGIREIERNKTFLPWQNKSNSTAETVSSEPFLGILLCTFVVIVIVGNLLVMVAVAKERYLRSVTNYLIVSLAVADLLVGSIVMPFSIILEIMNGVWVFGPDWCDLWHSFDVLGSTASILNLCVIALDRYWAITDPIAYPTKMSTRRVWILIVLVWVCSSAISFPAILWWRAVLENSSKHQCEFTDDSSYLLISSMVSFYAPLFIMGFVYYRIYSAATQRTKTLNSGGKLVTTEGCRGEVMTLRMHRGKKNSSVTTTQRNGHEHLTYQRAPFTDTETDSASHFTRSDSDDDRRPARFIKKKIQKFAISRKISKLAREQKAAKTLGIVMGVFIICWVPFFVANVLFAICHESCISNPDLIFSIFAWLGYLNSGMNPIIYALSMRDFRRAFKRILCMYCPKNPLPNVSKKKQPCVRSVSESNFSNVGDRYTAINL